MNWNKFEEMILLLVQEEASILKLEIYSEQIAYLSVTK